MIMPVSVVSSLCVPLGRRSSCYAPTLQAAPAASCPTMAYLAPASGEPPSVYDRLRRDGEDSVCARAPPSSAAVLSDHSQPPREPSSLPPLGATTFRQDNAYYERSVACLVLFHRGRGRP